MFLAPKLSLDDAQVVLAGSEAKAREIGIDMDVAVAFGNYIRQASARVIGLLPDDLPVEAEECSARRAFLAIDALHAPAAIAKHCRAVATHRTRRRP